MEKALEDLCNILPSGLKTEVREREEERERERERERGYDPCSPFFPTVHQPD